MSKSAVLKSERLIESLKLCLANANTPTEATYIDIDRDGGGIYCSEEYGAISLTENGYSAFTDFLDELCKDKFIEYRVGRSVAHDSLYRLLIELKSCHVNSDEYLVQSIQTFIESLKSSLMHTVAYAPVDNLYIEEISEPIRLGKVIFQPNAIMGNQVKTKIKDWVSQHKKYNSAEKEARETDFLSMFDSSFGGSSTIAKVRVYANSSVASRVAEDEIELALNVLRSYTYLIHSRQSQPLIGLHGTAPGCMREYFIFSEDKSHMYWQSRLIGGMRPYTLNPRVLTHLNENCALPIISDILAKPDEERSDIETVLVTTIRWLGQGVNSPHIPERVLNFAVALELLLTAGIQGDVSIRSRVGRRLACVWSDDKHDRIKVCSRGKSLYDLRSKVVHRGITAISECEVNDLYKYTVIALIRIAERLHEWAEFAEFAKWADGQEFDI